MISIKKFLQADNEREQMLLHVVQLLLRGIALHAVEGDGDDLARFRESVDQVLHGLEDAASEEFLVKAGSAIHGLESYNRRTTNKLRLRTAELQNMLGMMSMTLRMVAAASDANISRLQAIEAQVHTAIQLEDVRIVKSRLSDCLEDIRKEVARQRTETARTVDQLNGNIEQFHKNAAGEQELAVRDQVTGLPLRPEAETALVQSLRSKVPTYVGVMVLDRLQTLNLRFGREVGDEVLQRFARAAQSQLASDDRLYRWSGPVLVALLMRTGSLEFVRGEFGRIMDINLEYSVQTASRSILLPITARRALFPMTAAPRLLFQKIDQFAGLPGARE